MSLLRILAFLALLSCGSAFAQTTVLGLGAHEFSVARQTGSGFQLFEKGFGSRCGVDALGGEAPQTFSIVSSFENGFGDSVCEHRLFQGKVLQNGWRMRAFQAFKRCEQLEGAVWVPIAEFDGCPEISVMPPTLGQSSLSTIVSVRVKGSGALIRKARRAVITYRYEIEGPQDTSPWVAAQ
ncbi:MAG: hypothetical protein IPO58_26075 [Betaproteobacteria bacterium]|nr:hypothetical protein [Betaproteobacteria bacterium]